jgi:hypothetical protein
MKIEEYLAMEKGLEEGHLGEEVAMPEEVAL